MFCLAVLGLQGFLTSPPIATPPPHLFTPLDLLPLVSPPGTGCHPLVSSLLGDHLGRWREELVTWCLSFNSGRRYQRRIGGMWCSLHCMRNKHSEGFFFSRGWNVVQAVTYCSPSRKDHCISLSLLIIFMHKKSWLKSCWVGLISSPQWSRIKTKGQKERKKSIVPVASINTIYFEFEGKLCLCRQTADLSVPSYCFALFIPADAVKHSWIVDDGLRNVTRRRFSLTRLSIATRGVYIRRSSSIVADALNNSLHITFGACGKTSWALIFDALFASWSWWATTSAWAVWAVGPTSTSTIVPLKFSWTFFFCIWQRINSIFFKKRWGAGALPCIWMMQWVENKESRFWGSFSVSMVKLCRFKTTI